MATPKFYPKNDFILEVTLTDVNSVGAEVPVATGTVTAFLAAANTPAAVAADPTLSVSASYTGAGGVWLITFDKTVMTQAVLDAAFPSAGVKPYLIVETVGGVRVYVKCKYVASRKATLA